MDLDIHTLRTASLQTDGSLLQTPAVLGKTGKSSSDRPIEFHCPLPNGKSFMRNRIDKKQTHKARHSGNRRSEAGFILPMAIWIVAIVGLAAATLNAWILDSVSNAQALRDKVESQIAFDDIVNELIYFRGRKFQSQRGLEVGSPLNPSSMRPQGGIFPSDITSNRVIRMDGRPYIVESRPEYVVRIYDARGLVNLNDVPPRNLRRLFSYFGYSEAQINRFVDTHLDYRDEDDLIRLAGAEKTDYERRGYAPPRNFHIITPLEAQNIMDWETADKLWAAHLKSPIFHTCRSGGFNPNTASPLTIVTYVPGIQDDRVAEVIERRERRPFRNSREFGAAADRLLTNQPFFYTFVPGTCSVIELTNRNSSERIRFSLTLLPAQNEQPWQVDYVFRIPEESFAEISELDIESVFPSPEEIDGAERRSNRNTRIR